MSPDLRRRRRIWTAGVVAGMACVVGVWSFTLWPGAAIICGLVTGSVVGLLYGVAYDVMARR